MPKENVKNLKDKDAKEKELKTNPSAEALEANAELSIEDLDKVSGGYEDEIPGWDVVTIV